MRDGEGYAELAGGFHQVIGLLEIEAERLLAEDGDAGFHRLHGGIVMDEVGRDDEDVVELLVGGSRRVGGDHFIVGTVTLDRIGPVFRLFESDLGIREQCARGDAAGAVHVDGLLMGMNDEGTFASSDEADVEWFVRHGCGFRVSFETGGPGRSRLRPEDSGTFR